VAAAKTWLRNAGPESYWGLYEYKHVFRDGEGQLRVKETVWKNRSLFLKVVTKICIKNNAEEQIVIKKWASH
jgi:hypothetical protein